MTKCTDLANNKQVDVRLIDPMIYILDGVSRVSYISLDHKSEMIASMI